ncbi:hypothetical protein ACFV1W_30230 [Kitasatospora sp. NPDC059648]|uniref:hypothetical protein n=1 Tax=Kitasatospora sp. NPDC059648 TaxID=3346894 RepID=UPI0036C175AF
MIERHGHEVVVDRHGLAIDGQRICRTPLGPETAVKPSEDPKRSRTVQVTPDGGVVYRGRLVAELAPPPAGTANPGEVIVHGPNGPVWPGARVGDQPVPGPAPPPVPDLQASVDELQAAATQLANRQQQETDERTRAEQPGIQPPSIETELEISR